MKRLTVGILAHVDAGKTTLTEGLMYLSGNLRKLGRVDHGDAFLDTDSLEREREKLVLDAKLKAQEILRNAKAISDNVVSEAKRLKQEAADGKDANLAAARAAFRGQLSEAEKKVAAQRAERKAMPLPRELKVGDVVEIVATRTTGTVLTLPDKDGKLTVQAGILKIKVGKDEIQLSQLQKPAKPAMQPKTSSVRLSAPENRGTSLDLRGQNGDEAIMEVDRFIDNAVRLHLEAVTIIHGKGTGVLRQRVQTHLRSHPQVKSFRLGNSTCHTFAAGGEDQLCAVGLQQAAPLNTHGVRHGEDHTVAFGNGHGGQTDAGVAAGWLDDSGSLLEEPPFLGIEDHGKSHTVLGAAGRVEVLQLGKQNTVKILLFGKTVQSQQRCAAHKFSNAVINSHRNSSKAKISWGERTIR